MGLRLRTTGILFGLLCMLFIPSAWATIRRAPGAYLFGPTAVWTNNTVVDVFHPLSDPMPSAQFNSVRWTQEMSQSTGNCEIKAALRYGPDGVVWDAAQNVANVYRATDGVDVGTGYVDVVTGFNQKAWVQFGVNVRNVNAGTKFENCNAAIQIEPKQAP
jgi:hypothetical protein